MAEQLKDADACITCWHTPSFTDEMLINSPKLRLIAHAAGAVRNLVPPSFWHMQGKHITSNAPVIADGNVITSQGPGTAMLFALVLVQHLAGDEAAHRVADGLLTQF